MAPRKSSLVSVPPIPVDDEQRQPLLDAEHPDHGTISRQQADDEEVEDQVEERVSLARVLVVVGPLWIATFFAAAGS